MRSDELADVVDRDRRVDALEGGKCRVNVLALDLSLTASGFAGSDDAGTLRPPASVGKALRRLVWIRDAVLELADGADLVVVEGYAFSSRGRQHAAGELGGLVRVALWERAVPLAEVPPSNLKKLATGKGNAAKEAVLAAAIRRLGYAGSDHNEADALWLLEAARQRYGLPGAAALPKVHLAALEAVEWPELEMEAVPGPTGAPASPSALSLFGGGPS